VQSDVVRILDVYRSRGHFNAQVVPKTIEPKQGGKNDRVNLVFEIKEGEKLAVKDIVFTGNTAFSQTKLKAIVKTGVSNVLSFVLDNDIYDPDRVENDKDLVRRFYLAHGYADMRVSSATQYDARKKGAVVTFKVDEGPQYRFGKVEIQSRLNGVDGNVLRNNLRSESGAIYDADAVGKSVEDLAIALAKSGEPFASVVPHSERRADRRLIDISYRIEQGRRLYIERIQIHGNIKTRDEVIRREFDVGEGDAYNRAVIDRGERHLKALGYFKSACGWRRIIRPTNLRQFQPGVQHQPLRRQVFCRHADHRQSWRKLELLDLQSRRFA
jgi:outer membrane protein insertion porin family